ncbi:helix-turn-helix domain-containing protein [Parahaliea mediterranea]|uniref:helix-turn-helix domain-containing protein n=1 Tax=Parahaliea mediterranea TaxID=651086 RepID=UPI0013005554|nr:helix-turn-helix domain-containing protein [Parahaliea mediterranea]
MAEVDTAVASPGAMLRRAREARKLSPEEVTRRMNWLPCYVGIIERDDYAALRRPTFARGYVRAYGKLLEVPEGPLMAAFDEVAGELAGPGPVRRVAPARSARHTQLLQIAVGIVLLAMLVAGLWWWRGSATQSVVALDWVNTVKV